MKYLYFISAFILLFLLVILVCVAVTLGEHKIKFRYIRNTGLNTVHFKGIKKPIKKTYRIFEPSKSYSGTNFQLGQGTYRNYFPRTLNNQRNNK